MAFDSNTAEEDISWVEEEEEEETEEMMAIRSITEEGFSALKAQEFHRKRNKPRQRETVDYNPAHAINISTLSTNQQDSQSRNNTSRDVEDMLAIRSISGDVFNSEADELIQETNMKRDCAEDSNSIDRLEQDLVPAANERQESQSSPSDQEGFSQPKEGLGQTVADHYNQKANVNAELRKTSRIVYMRNFNNWTKSMLIDEYLSRIKSTNPLGSSIKVLDMGSGKGGDMLKWLNGGVKHVVFADIAEVSIEDCKTRYEELKKKENAKSFKRVVFSADFLPADCSKIRLRSLYEDKSLELDLVSCQFCIHYSFESIAQARCMLKNAAECLKPGGFFVGTVPDSNQIVARQRRHANNSFGNDVYRIECLFDTRRPIPLFGAKYHFNLEGVVNCPEFLVHFGLFEKIATEFGLKLVLKENFKTFYERKIKDHAGVQLIRRMNALETYPPSEGVDTVGQETDYCHAEAYLSDHPGDQKLGTLSKAEWEAITLYQVFAFEKVKSQSASKRSAPDSSSCNSSNKTSKTS